MTVQCQQSITYPIFVNRTSVFCCGQQFERECTVPVKTSPNSLAIFFSVRESPLASYLCIPIDPCDPPCIFDDVRPWCLITGLRWL